MACRKNTTPCHAWFVPCVMLFFLFSCNRQAQKGDLFVPVAPDFNNQTVVLPEGFRYTVLFSEGDTVIAPDGRSAPARGSHDLVVYIPINGSNEHGYLYVSHETHHPHPVLGDGGGATFFEVKKINGEWSVISKLMSVDFSTVGGTIRNCGGTLTPHGTVLTAEEEFPMSNTELMLQNGITDTSDINGRKKFLHFGYMVEVDMQSGKALRKLYGMGRYSHEDAHCMPDGKTVYLTSDSKPAVLFKFVADKAGDYSAGQLYAYAQSEDASGGRWIPLPMHPDSLMNITDVALRLGAGMGIRHEWIDADGDKLYIAETGSDEFSFAREIKTGGKPFHYFAQLATGTNTYKDNYGRILELDLKTNRLRVLLEGGVADKDSAFCFSNPDAITVASIRGKKYLVISEDNNGNTLGRVIAAARERGQVYNEIYFLDLSVSQPTLRHLKRFMAAPEGCETTGNCFTPDGKSYFVSIQHPSRSNTPPFNRSAVIAITGF
ncbi:MAG: PhoX family protein [Chitinophagales bacterium]|nr:PhoX family protein [Chitinophagales bacterium]